MIIIYAHRKAPHLGSSNIRLPGYEANDASHNEQLNLPVIVCEDPFALGFFFT